MGRTCGEPDEIGLTPMGVELNGPRRVHSLPGVEVVVRDFGAVQVQLHHPHAGRVRHRAGDHRLGREREVGAELGTPANPLCSLPCRGRRRGAETAKRGRWGEGGHAAEQRGYVRGKGTALGQGSGGGGARSDAAGDAACRHSSAHVPESAKSARVATRESTLPDESPDFFRPLRVARRHRVEEPYLPADRCARREPLHQRRWQPQRGLGRHRVAAEPGAGEAGPCGRGAGWSERQLP